jgi:hypothetical protein
MADMPIRTFFVAHSPEQPGVDQGWIRITWYVQEQFRDVRLAWARGRRVPGHCHLEDRGDCTRTKVPVRPIRPRRLQSSKFWVGPSREPRDAAGKGKVTFLIRPQFERDVR